jgi:hypothetical protein
MTTAKPFTINVPDRELDDLKQRLALTRFPDELDDAAWKYGAPLADVRRLAEYGVTGTTGARMRQRSTRRCNSSRPPSPLPASVRSTSTSCTSGARLWVRSPSCSCTGVSTICLCYTSFSSRIYCRARLVPGGGQGPPALDRRESDEPELPRGRAQPPRIRLLAGAV